VATRPRLAFGWCQLHLLCVWSKGLAAVVLASALVNFLIARGLDAAPSSRKRRFLVGLSLAVNVGLLVYFKYADFFLRSLEEALREAGCPAALPVLSVLLPIGISFYTFEAISYTVDVYHRRMPAERSVGNFLLFILFFPHLVAGPIVRAHDFLPQVRRAKRWSWIRLRVGVRLILLGMLKKMALADRMPLYVDPVFANPGDFSAAPLWLAAVAYALQVYGDFSGYSDLAIGLAHLLGYRLAPNFALPYFAPNIGEFWRRWHISLSSWIRDYLFFNMGGSRGGEVRTARNLLVAMGLCGLWHGAQWNYVAFGLLHGLLLLGHRWFWATCRGLLWLEGLLVSGPGTVVRITLTFAVFCLTLVVFRCTTLASAGVMLPRMLCGQRGAGLPLSAVGLWLTVGAVLVCYLAAASGQWERVLGRLPVPIRGLMYGTALTLALVLAPRAGQAFIYFQF
jgi:alginate O-acetyltransferase complex protein AlgI